MEYGYIRVSSREQNIDRQLDAIRKFIIDITMKIFPFALKNVDFW
ncbi:MAG: recombinase family protein [Acutalibacteraceae bacterium]